MTNLICQITQPVPTFLGHWVTPTIYTAIAPVLLALFVAALRSVAVSIPPNLDTILDISIDLAVAAIGASGEAFKAYKGTQILGMDATTALYVSVLINVAWVGCLFCIKKFWRVTDSIACGCLFLSSLTLMVGLIKYTGITD